MSTSESVNHAKNPELSSRGRVRGDPASNIACLRIIGRALDGGTVTIDGKLRNPNVSDVDIQKSIDAAYYAFVDDKAHSKAFELFRVLFVYPARALTRLPEQLRKIPAAHGRRRESEDLTSGPEFDAVDKSIYGRTLLENAELIVVDPESISPTAVEILAADIEGVPDFGCADGPWLPYVLHRIQERVRPPLRGPEYWKYALIVQGIIAALILIFGLLSQSDASLAAAAVLLAFLGCSLNGYLQENLLSGFDRYTLASVKSLAKVPSVLAVVSAVTTTLVFRGDVLMWAVVVALAASVLLAVSGLCADCLINHAEAAMK